jgi:hypothetical protein
MELDPEKRQILADAMEYGVQATVAGQSEREILLALRGRLKR